MSARTRRTARSSITGWPRTPRSRSPSPSAIRRGRKIVDLRRATTRTLPPPRRPGTKAGLNRFVWDMKYPGPTKLDYGLAPPRPKPLVPDPENPPGPTVVPGSYGVDLDVGGKTQSAQASPWSRTRACRPRRPTTPRSSPCTGSWWRRCPSSRRRSIACAAPSASSTRSPSVPARASAPCATAPRRSSRSSRPSRA